uniref:Photosystem I assembly protein Ycf4 n=1 Tax=Mallomonas splendens TaxID=52552 RepID=A0A3G2QZI6_9STRA|nr:photosystem I assembly protein Ycf4 [Mallomonas splendens]AYO28550.1 photosystem I assembly protein Ycf4 [Mallomonas splendens]
MNESIIRQDIIGSRNLSSFLTMIILFLAGLGFFLAGLSSYFQRNFLIITETTEINFIPQGIAMLFYGTGAIGLGIYLLLSIIWNLGSGYNEFSKLENIVRLVRLGFPGKNRTIFLSYEFKNIKNLKFLIKQGLNPRCNILLVLKDKREIPLFPAQILMNPLETEKKAIQLANFLNVPLESLVI